MQVVTQDQEQATIKVPKKCAREKPNTETDESRVYPAYPKAAGKNLHPV